MKFLKALALTLPLAGLVTTNAQALLIDAFELPPQSAAASGPPPGMKMSNPTNTLLGPVLGGERDLFVRRTTSNSGNVSAAINTTLPGLLRYGSSANTRGDALVTYDGLDNLSTGGVGTGISLTPGLGSLNFTAAGLTTFQISAASNLGATVRFEVFSSSGSSIASVVLPPVGGSFPLMPFFIPFASFVGAADFGDIDAITLLVDGTANPGTQVRIDFFAAVPEPGTLALLGAGVLGLGWQHRRKRSNKA